MPLRLIDAIIHIWLLLFDNHNAVLDQKFEEVVRWDLLIPPFKTTSGNCFHNIDAILTSIVGVRLFHRYKLLCLK